MRCAEQARDWAGVGMAAATPEEAGRAGTLPSLGWAGMDCAGLRRLGAGLGSAGQG